MRGFVWIGVLFFTSLSYGQIDLVTYQHCENSYIEFRADPSVTELIEFHVLRADSSTISEHIQYWDFSSGNAKLWFDNSFTPDEFYLRAKGVSGAQYYGDYFNKNDLPPYVFEANSAICSSGIDGSGVFRSLRIQASTLGVVGTVNDFLDSTLLSDISTENFVLKVEYESTCIINFNLSLPISNLDVAVVGHQDVLCNGDSSGMFTLDIIGGEPPYSISYMPSEVTLTGTEFSSLPAQDYSVTVTDDLNCEYNLVVTVQEPPVLVLDSFEIYPDTCGDGLGKIEVYASGGVFPYWPIVDNQVSDAFFTIDSVSMGVRDLQVADANGCMTDPIQVTLGNIQGVVPSVGYPSFCEGQAVLPNYESDPNQTYMKLSGTGSIHAVSGQVSGGISGSQLEIRVTDGLCGITTDTTLVATSYESPFIEYQDVCLDNGATLVPLIQKDLPASLSEVIGVSDAFYDNGQLYVNIPGWLVIRNTTPNCAITYIDSIWVNAGLGGISPDIVGDFYACSPSLAPLAFNEGQNEPYELRWLHNGQEIIGESISIESIPYDTELHAYYIDQTTGCFSDTSSHHVFVENPDDYLLFQQSFDCPDKEVWFSKSVGDYVVLSDVDNINESDYELGVYASDTLSHLIYEVAYGDNCIFTDTIEISYNYDGCGQIHATTLLSPNGDGINDYWEIFRQDSGVHRIQVTLFNRDGTIINDFNNYGVGGQRWEGFDLKGNQVANGTYWYVIKYNNQQLSGWVFLNR